MKLKELLTKTTPLPWDAKKTFASDQPTQSCNRIYAAHAANSLPRLVESLHDMLADAAKYPQLELCDHHKQRLIEIISRAENVKMPNASNSATGDRGASPAKADGKA